MGCGIASPAGRWISVAEAARRLGTNHVAVRRMIAGGHLTVRRLPGCNPRIPAEEVERLARESIRPAAAG